MIPNAWKQMVTALELARESLLRARRTIIFLVVTNILTLATLATTLSVLL